MRQEFQVGGKGRKRRDSEWVEGGQEDVKG